MLIATVNSEIPTDKKFVKKISVLDYHVHTCWQSKSDKKFVKKISVLDYHVHTCWQSKSEMNKSFSSLLRQLHKQDPSIESLHQLRASRIRICLGQSNLLEVQYKAGHRYVSSTERYKDDGMEDFVEG